jgi:hypothetical protein
MRQAVYEVLATLPCRREGRVWPAGDVRHSVRKRGRGREAGPTGGALHAARLPAPLRELVRDAGRLAAGAATPTRARHPGDDERYALLAPDTCAPRSAGPSVFAALRFQRKDQRKNLYPVGGAIRRRVAYGLDGTSASG